MPSLRIINVHVDFTCLDRPWNVVMDAPKPKVNFLLFMKYVSWAWYSQNYVWTVLFTCCSIGLISALRPRLPLLFRMSAQDSINSISFPYESSPDDLPVSLPTTDQIEGSEDVLLERLGAKVVTVGSYFVVKYGYGVNLEEGRTMMFVREYTTDLVPRVYALFNDPKTGKKYIIMERIHGRTLADEWSSLEDYERRELCLQLRDHLHALRQIRSKAFCSVANKPLRDTVFWTADKSVNWAGPFNSELQLNKSIVEIYKLSESEIIQQKAEYCERVLSGLLNHKPKFTHGDLQPKNIMIIRGGSGLKKRLVILDWETAGFYPEYWEYARASGPVRDIDDWESYLDDILVPFPSETKALRMVFDNLSC
jgi:serine/threonine protein kinase